MNATSTQGPALWSNTTPPSFPSPSSQQPPDLPGVRLGPPFMGAPRHMRPFFIREIYKNGFLKRLPHNEKKSSAFSKLMRSDRFWVVFSVHDESLPFLELWNEPSEVAMKPPAMIFPLIICQHISPSLVPADTEWTFVINLEQSAVRFSCNSRQTMEEWVECIRNKLGEMGIFNPKGNLYSKVGNSIPGMNIQPSITSRNPMSPLPDPPMHEGESAASPITNSNNTPGNRTSIVEASDPTNLATVIETQTFTTSIYLNQTTPPNTPLTQTGARPKTTTGQSGSSSVYLNKSSPTRHVTVIPINNDIEDGSETIREDSSSPTRRDDQRQRRSRRNSSQVSSSEQSFNERQITNEGSQLPRRLSDRNTRVRRRSQRSSSLGPLLDDQHLASALAGLSTRTNSLESIDSNPRQAVAKSDRRESYHRRPLPRIPGSENQVSVFGSPPRNPPSTGFHLPASGIPLHIPLPGLTCHMSYLMPTPAPPTPAVINGVPPQSLPSNVNTNSTSHHHPDIHPQTRSPKEQQVLRLRQEIAHPAGVRLTLRKRDCINSLALVDFFGCLWVAGWKQQTDFPILYKAFHIGDQILSIGSGMVPVRTSSEFHKIVKQKTAEMHIEIIVRRVPFAQTFFIKREAEGQPLGIVANTTNSELREIVPGSPASIQGMTSKIRSFDGQTFVSWCITEINGRPMNLFSKDGEAADRLQNTGRDLSIVIQPSDIINRLRKHLKSVKSYKDYLLN